MIFDAEVWKVGVALWGAALSSVLAVIKIWESVWKDRVRIRATYSFTEAPGEDDEIIIYNLSPIPIQIIHWTLAWKSTSWFKSTSDIDVTPEDGGAAFKISGRDAATLRFPDHRKFDWSHRVARGRRLIMKLRPIGSRRDIIVKVHDGQ